jgi:predicted DsbA family dithiol-disulfide isomerase
VRSVAIAVQIFSDYTCPHCYIGAGIVDKLKEEFPLEDTWVSFEIHPETAREGKALTGLLGANLSTYEEGLRRRGTELGLHFAPPALLSNTRLAIEASEFARDSGKLPEFHRATLAAYFARGEDIGDLDVLAGLAAEVGLDHARLRMALTAGWYRGKRETNRDQARNLRVTAVPTYIFAQGTRVVGAQPLDHFRRLLTSGADL